MRRVALVLGLSAALVAGTASAAGARPAHLTIIHYYRGCHVWTRDGSTPVGPTVAVVLAPGERLLIVNHDIMSFVFRQSAGPPMALGDPLTRPAGARTLAFVKPSVYRFEARATQHADEMGVQTVGLDNVLVLTVRVR